jgi:hypothetical protein
MQKEMLELITKSTETAMEAARKLSELNMRSFEAMLQQQAEMFGAYMDMTTKSIEVAGKAKGVQELISGQTELSREFGERGMETLRKNVAAASATGAEYGALLQEGVKTAQEQMATLAKTTLKAA